MRKLCYQPITRENLDMAVKILKEGFPDFYGSAYMELIAHLDGKSEIVVQPLLVYDGENAIGTTGFYDIGNEGEVWLWFYCVATEFRKKGIGTQILLDSINMAQEIEGKKVLRIYTFSTWNSSAQGIYKKHMNLAEYYDNPADSKFCIEQGKPMVYSVGLNKTAPLPWDNRFIDFDYELRNHEVGKKLVKGVN